MWSRPGFADAVRQASEVVADRIDTICTHGAVEDKRVRRATTSAIRYLLRATGRPTPFGLFAGVAHVGLSSVAQTRWGAGHRPAARVDTEWLAEVINRLEGCPELLQRLDVVFTNLAARRGGRLEAPQGPNRVTIRYTRAVQAVRDAAARPIRFGVLASKLTKIFPSSGEPEIRRMLTELVRQGFLVTCLRAPLTVTDPLAHVVALLRTAGADSLPVSGLLCDLEAIQAGLHHHNHEVTTGHGRLRAAATRRMRELAPAQRIPLAVDLLLGCEVELPSHVAHEIKQAAGVLLRLTRQPAGLATWREFHSVFCERYGTGTLVPVTQAIDPDAGLGYPAGYPGSVLPLPADVPAERDERLLTLAVQAVTDGSDEITLTGDTIAALTTGDRFADGNVPPHIELSARIHATSTEALTRGNYILTIAPARAAGTMTSRFTPLATGSGLEEAYRTLPAGVEGALSAQISFQPVYPHAENICRIPAYLPDVLSLGEHRAHSDKETVIAVDDLAITATRDRLHLVSISRRRVVEPQVYHALALDKQAPPLARFLANLPRAFSARWHEFDWGPHAHRLPYLPRVRYQRTIISPARWRLAADDLPRTPSDDQSWMQALDRWRHRWRCPGTAELRDADRTLRLTLGEPAHAAILRAHLHRHGEAVLTEAATPAEFGWLGGHAHEIAFPLVAVRSAATGPPMACLPTVTNATHGQLPGSPDAAWMYAKIHSHPERHDEIITGYLPRLLAALGGEPRYWFVRYHSPHESGHLRLRIRTPGPEHYAACVAAVGRWAEQLRHDGLAGRLVIDTYYPETGRYGPGAAMEAAEEVFAADSQAVCAALRHLPATVIHPTALAAVSMIDIASGFLGNAADAVRWLAARPAPTTTTVTDRTVAGQAFHLVRNGGLRNPPGGPGEVTQAWQTRAAALSAYRRRLPAGADTDGALESLLHMHHNRAIGIDPGAERACRRLARQAALAWRAQQAGNCR